MVAEEPQVVFAVFGSGRGDPTFNAGRGRECSMTRTVPNAKRTVIQRGCRPQMDVQDINSPPSNQHFRGQVRSITNSDIAGSTSRTRHPARRNKPDNQLRTDDVASKLIKHLHTKRCTDPIQPQYKLSSTRPSTAPICRTPGTHSVRHESTRQCADIPGTSAVSSSALIKTRPNAWNSDIERARPKPGRRVVLSAEEQQQVEEGIAQQKQPPQISLSSRRTNVLDPTYRIHGAVLSTIEGSKSRCPPRDSAMPNRSLDTADIAGPPSADPALQIGARSFSLSAGMLQFERFERRQRHSTNYNADIEGASSQNPVANPMLSTKRRTNPLTANNLSQYPYIGGNCFDDVAATPQPAARASSPPPSTPVVPIIQLPRSRPSTGRSRPQSAYSDSRSFRTK